MRVKYTKELLERAIENARSIADICRFIGLKPLGSNYKTVKNKLDLFNIDYSHLAGQNWNKGLKHVSESSRFPLSEILKENIDYSSDALKKRLIAEGIKEPKCEICGCTSENAILELHHINGNHFDNRLENLQILCPNCHSLTPNHRGKNDNRGENPVNLSKKFHKDHYCVCQNCGETFYSDRIDRTRKFCSVKCYREYVANYGSINENINSVSEKLTKEVLQEACEKFDNISDLANYLNTNRTTIRNYLKKFDLYEDFKFKYDFHAKPVVQYDLEGNEIKIWPSITDAEQCLHCSISKCLSGQSRSAGGFRWKYYNK